MPEKPDIQCAPDGPLLVRNLGSLKNSEGADLPTKEKIALCRCGGSKNKPFCDGAHKGNGFSSRKETDGAADREDTYAGRDITIRDNRGTCAHLGYCTKSLASVFKYKQEPWIDPDGAPKENVVRAVFECPSGALGQEGETEPELPPGITVSKNGPYFVVGGVSLPDVPKNKGASEVRYALCRCGASKNKPFCDGAHWAVKFEDEEN